MQVYPRLSSSRAEEYASDSWYCVAWQPVYTIPCLPDQAPLAKGSFLTFHTLAAKPAQPGGFHFPMDKAEDTTSGQAGEKLSRGRTRSRSCSPNQQVNATPLSPVPRLKFHDGDEDQGSGSASSSPSSSPIGSASSGTLRRERSHSSPAIGRRDRSHNDLVSPGAHSRRDGNPRSGGERKATHADSTLVQPQEHATGEGKAAHTPRTGHSEWGDLPARELSPSLDAVAPPSGEESPSTEGATAAGEKSAEQLSPPQVKQVNTLEGSEFPALGAAPQTQLVGNDPAAAKGSGAAQSSTATAAPAKSAWGGRTFAAIVRAGSTGREHAPSPNGGATNDADAEISTNAGSSRVVESSDGDLDTGISTIAVTVTVSPNAQRAADWNKSPGGKPVKLTGAWQQKSVGKAPANVEAAEVALSPTATAKSATAQSASLSSPAGSGSPSTAKSEAPEAAGTETQVQTHGENDTAPSAESRAGGTGSHEIAGRKRQEQVEPTGPEPGSEDDEDCGVDMSPGLIGLGIGQRVDTVVWELNGDDAAGAGGSDSDGVVGMAPNGNDDDDDGVDGAGGMQRVHRLVRAVPSLLQAGRVALPGA